MRFAALGMKVCVADIGEAALKAAEARIAATSLDGGANVMATKVDVSSRDELTALEGAVQKRFGGTDILMNNAGISPGAKMFGRWRTGSARLRSICGASSTARRRSRRTDRAPVRLIINTGSKQGITTPPGEPAYNVSKAGVKAFTEALQHELRNTALQDHRAPPDPRSRPWA
jgi:NAD(P)-dependent dehydrogenase (short-subunit alcohol dehydrogenase family)